jgi:hypothetical protein
MVGPHSSPAWHLGRLAAREALAAAGWLLMTVAILLGCLLGRWFWVSSRSGPDGVDDPFSPGRMALVGSGVRSMVVIATNTPLDNVSGLG